MIVDRIYTPGLAQVAYLVADEAAGVTAVIDPRRDIETYLEWAAVRDLRIVAILETHVHADFVSGARDWRRPLAPPSSPVAAGSRSSLIIVSTTAMRWRSVTCDSGRSGRQATLPSTWATY
jgi:glyoxylase-like metal-dependent hydrolase (beta-lactamase superfamily II)